MEPDPIKRTLVIIAACVIALLLAWIGIRFLFVSNDTLNDTQSFVLGIFLVLGGIIVISSAAVIQGALWIGAMLIVFGFYLFGRTAGMIGYPWLAKILGLMFLCAAGMLVYVVWPKNNDEIKREDDL